MAINKFLNCKIDSSQRVFRPRSETKFWVGKAMEDSGFKNKNLRVLDVFSGSGCIGISLLSSFSNIERIDFVDIWPAAIKQIKINLDLNKTKENRYKIYKSNLFQKLKGRKYNFIFANPPYVALNRISEVQKEVLKNDPAVALFGGKDGMVIIEKFFKQVKSYLKPNGKIFLEFDPKQKKTIKELLEGDGFRFIFRKDQFKKDRWLEVWLI